MKLKSTTMFPCELLPMYGNTLSLDVANAKQLILFSGDNNILPSFNEYTLNINRVKIAENPFGGLKGSGSPDYRPGTISTSSDGIYITDVNGNNSTKTLSAGKLTELNSMTVNTVTKTITEEFIIKNEFTSNSPTVIDNCDSITGWTAAFGTNPTVDSNGSEIHIKAIGQGSAIILQKIVQLNLSNYEFVTVAMRRAADSAGDEVFFRLTDNAGKTYIVYNSNRFIVGTSETLFHFPLKAPAGTTGSLPVAVSTGFNLSSIVKIEIGLSVLTGSSAECWINNISADTGKIAYVEIQTPDNLADSSLQIYAHNGTAYQLTGTYKLDQTYSAVSITSANWIFKDSTKLDDVFGLGSGRALYPKSISGATVAGSGSTNLTYSGNKGTKNRIGLMVKLPPSDNGRTSFNKIRLKTVLNYTDCVGNIVSDLSENKYTGAIKGGVTKIAPNGLSFDGSTGYISLPGINITWRAALSNSESYIISPTYDGSNQACHPSVLKFDTAWNGYKYWMAMTPYPGSNDNYENPSILVSNDGINFIVPPGVTNPLVPATPGHNCDADLMYDDTTDELRIYWLDCRRAVECPGYEGETWYNHQYLMMIKSADGITWSDPEISIDWDLDTAFLEVAPSIIKRGDVWECFTTNGSGLSSILYRRTSSNGLTWSAYTEIASGEKMWHTQVRYIPEKSQYWAISSYPSVSGDLRFTSSSDGINWNTYPYMLLKHNTTSDGWDSHLYRTSFIYDSDTDTIEIWYSGHNSANVWHIGHIATNYTNMISALDNTSSGITVSARINIRSAKASRVVNKYLEAPNRVFSLAISSSQCFIPEMWGYDSDNANTMTTSASSVIPLNTWVRVSATFDGKTLRAYLNKSNFASNKYQGTQLRKSATGISIGRFDGSGGSQYFDGLIDDVIIYDRPLSTEEISALCDNSFVDQTGLLAHYISTTQKMGLTTYEFEDSKNASYGLQNVIKPYFCTYDPVNRGINYYIFSKKPIGLTYNYDENGTIYNVFFILANNTKVFRGHLNLSDFTTDTNSDTIPDFISKLESVLHRLNFYEYTCQT